MILKEVHWLRLVWQGAAKKKAKVLLRRIRLKKPCSHEVLGFFQQIFRMLRLVQTLVELKKSEVFICWSSHEICSIFFTFKQTFDHFFWHRIWIIQLFEKQMTALTLSSEKQWVLEFLKLQVKLLLVKRRVQIVWWCQTGSDKFAPKLLVNF